MGDAHSIAQRRQAGQRLRNHRRCGGQAVAEVLAGLVYVNALVPGALQSSVPGLLSRTCGRNERRKRGAGSLMAACAQMGRYYGLPTGIAAGMTDSKLPMLNRAMKKGIPSPLRLIRSKSDL